MTGKMSSEQGYTLIETVVAMALFLSVLIPLVATVGNVMFDRKSMLLQKALIIAQTEMSRIAAKKNYVETTRIAEGGLIVARTIQKRRPLVEIRVAVKTSGEQSKELVALKQVMIDYEAIK